MVLRLSKDMNKCGNFELFLYYAIAAMFDTARILYQRINAKKDVSGGKPANSVN